MARHFSMLRDFTLADFLTLGNAACGVAALFAAVSYVETAQLSHFYAAVALGPAAFLFDALDGRVARWRQEHSAMGRELDSLAEVEADVLKRMADANEQARQTETRRMTLEDFVMANGLLRQLPRPQWPEYVTWLKSFCQAYSLNVQKDPVPGRPWEGENAYPITALGALLRHEQTRPRQLGLIHTASRHAP